MTQLTIKIKREEEKHVKVAFAGNFGGQACYGTATIIDGELTKFTLSPTDYRFRFWFETKARLRSLRRFLKAVEKEILYVEQGDAKPDDPD